MLNFLLSNLKANFCIFLIIFNSMTLLLILIPPIQKTLTYLHELGHCMHLYYAYKKLNIKHQKSVIMPLQRTKGIFYKREIQLNTFKNTKDKGVLAMIDFIIHTTQYIFIGFILAYFTGVIETRPSILLYTPV